MEEDPAEVYIRARNDLLKSAVDFHDYEDNIANCYHSKAIMLAWFAAKRAHEPHTSSNRSCSFRR